MAEWEQVQFGAHQPVINMSDKIYRKGTTSTPFEINFLICGGGIGDYTCWMSSIKWILDTQFQIIVNLYVQKFFIEIADKLFVGKYPGRIRVRNIMELEHVDLSKIGATYRPENERFPNGMGMHLVDQGFAIFTNHMPHGEYRNHPKLDVSDVVVPFDIPKPYAVVTTGHTTDAREWRARGPNGVSKYLKEKGITPVFLGKVEMFKAKNPDGSDIKYTAGFSKDIDYSLGIDLRDKTTLLQAAKIMADAQVVVGLDNGLLHLAGTQEVPIVMALNIATPQEREIRRSKGKTQYLTPDTQKLPCTFCQSNQRFNSGQDFKFCAYKDYVCLDILSEPSEWIKAIELVTN